MADLVLWLAQSVVEGTLSKATAAIEAETALRESAKNNLEFITGEFKMMQSFLQLANAERVENAVVMTWIRQIRDLAYDVEDCVEFVLHLDTKSSWSWSRRLIPSCCKADALPLDIAPSCCKADALPLDIATQDLKELKARVEEVSSRNHKYSLISDTGSNPVVVQQQQAATGVTTALSNNILIGGARDTGRWQQQGDLTQLLADGNKDLRVVSVWGSGGNLGVTSIIWKAFHGQEIRHNFTCRAWMKLVHPFDPNEFVRCLANQFYTNESKQTEDGETIIGLDVLNWSRSSEHQVEFARRVNKERYLVVLEDLSSMTDWDAITKFFPERKNGSCIIVSTQQTEVASLSVGHPYGALELNQFSDDHSVYAFYKEGSQCEEEAGEKTIGNASTSNCKNKEISQRDGDNKASSSSSDISEKGNHLISGKQKEANDWIDNNKLVGREAEMNVLRRYTTDVCFDSIQFMSVWGIAGVGKSSLVKKLFCEEIINYKNNGRTFDKYGWVDVSYPFKLRDFSRSLLLNFHSESLKMKESATERNNPIVQCEEILKHYKCLVVIDGLQSTDHWDLIQAELLFGSSDNCIITIASEASIATHCCGDKGEYVFNVKGLEADVAYDLFKTKVSAGGNPLHTPLSAADEFELQELVSKCGGLPKVIVEIASSIGTKTVEKMKSVRSLSNKFMHDLEKNREFDRLEGLFSWVRTYLQSCPDFLKPCIFYLSIFPRDFPVRRRRLLRRWIAEGYSRDNHEEFAEQSSEKQFRGLLDLSLIQMQPQKIAITAQSDTRKILYQVNGFIREYIVSKRMEENLVFELGDSSTITTQRTGRHLVILKSWKRDRIVFESMDFSRLRSLTVFGGWESYFISDSMRLLRVLDLENASGLTEDDLKKVVKVLRRLKFLSLRGHSEIFHLPGSLHKLRQLETLDVRGTSITTLPEKITRLQRLQYIRAGTMCVQHPVSSSNNTVRAPASSSSNNTVRAPASSSSNSTAPAPVSSSNNTVPASASSSNVTVQAPVSSSNNTIPAPASSSNVTSQAAVSSSNVSVDAPAPSSCSWLPGFCRCHRPTVGVEVPIGTGRLTALHTLGVVDIAASGANSAVEGLKQLTQLRKLGVSGITSKNSNKFISAIKGHVHLESLSVQFDKKGNQYCCFRKDNTNNKGCLDDMLSLPCGNLLSLKLYGLEDKLPSWGDDKLRKLTKLELEMASLTEDGTKFIGKLPELCIFRLKRLQEGQLHFLVEEHNEEDHSYEKLKVLEIGSSSDKLSVTFGSKTMKRLELLKVDCPSASSFQFSGMKNLAKLREVRLVKDLNNHKTQEEHLTKQLKENSDQIKPVVVLEEAPHSC